MDAATLFAAAAVVVSIVAPMAGFFLHVDRRITRLETMLETALEVRAVQRQAAAARAGLASVRGQR